MKRIPSLMICMVLALALPVVSYADVDLGAMSYAELVALKDQINLAMWECEEWQKVEVPQGVWQVGTDIPAGHWTMTVSDGACFCSINVGKELDETGRHLKDFDYGYASLVSSSYEYYSENTDLESVDFKLVEGAYIIIDGATVIFTPYQGKPSLGFKTSSTPGTVELSEKNDATATDLNTQNTEGELAAPQEPNADEVTVSQKNALRTAENYLAIMPFSYTGLIEQLEFEQYPYEDAVYAADNCGADWNKQAAEKAKQYLDIMAFSKEGLTQQLEFEGFTHEQAVYGVEASGY